MTPVSCLYFFLCVLVHKPLEARLYNIKGSPEPLKASECVFPKTRDRLSSVDGAGGTSHDLIPHVITPAGSERVLMKSRAGWEGQRGNGDQTQCVSVAGSGAGLLPCSR